MPEALRRPGGVLVFGGGGPDGLGKMSSRRAHCAFVIWFRGSSPTECLVHAFLHALVGERPETSVLRQPLTVHLQPHIAVAELRPIDRIRLGQAPSPSRA